MRKIVAGLALCALAGSAEAVVISTFSYTFASTTTTSSHPYGGVVIINTSDITGGSQTFQLQNRYTGIVNPYSAVAAMSLPKSSDLPYLNGFVHLTNGILDQIQGGNSFFCYSDCGADSYDIQSVTVNGNEYTYTDTHDGVSTSDSGTVNYPAPAVATPAVPEPETWALMLLGLGGLAAIRARSAASYRE